jgi:hypothetical protein
MMVKVLAIQKVRDVIDGSDIYNVNFGRSVPMTPDIKTRMIESEQRPLPGYSDVSLNSIILLIPFKKGPLPYKLDSEWDLEIGDDGSISLKEIK